MSITLDCQQCDYRDDRHAVRNQHNRHAWLVRFHFMPFPPLLSESTIVIWLWPKPLLLTKPIRCAYQLDFERLKCFSVFGADNNDPRSSFGSYTRFAFKSVSFHSCIFFFIFSFRSRLVSAQFSFETLFRAELCDVSNCLHLLIDSVLHLPITFRSPSVHLLLLRLHYSKRFQMHF